MTITAKQRENLAILAEFLKTVKPERFNMIHYRSNNGHTYCYDLEVKPPCGTAACAAGWGPAALGETEDIEDYFGDWVEENLIPEGTDAWSWCFSSKWTGTDNTPYGAALRIEYMLKYDLPPNWSNQMRMSAPHAPYMFADEVNAYYGR